MDCLYVFPQSGFTGLHTWLSFNSLEVGDCLVHPGTIMFRQIVKKTSAGKTNDAAFRCVESFLISSQAWRSSPGGGVPWFSSKMVSPGKNILIHALLQKPVCFMGKVCECQAMQGVWENIFQTIVHDFNEIETRVWNQIQSKPNIVNLEFILKTYSS